MFEITIYGASAGRKLCANAIGNPVTTHVGSGADRSGYLGADGESAAGMYAHALEAYAVAGAEPKVARHGVN